MSEPVRTCVACRTRRPQRTLVRLRRRSDGVVVPAVGRRTQGRSAYLCPTHTCFARAARRRALERALGRSSSASDGRSGRVRAVELDTLWSEVVAAVDEQIENLQRSGNIGRSRHHSALAMLRQALHEPGRSA